VSSHELVKLATRLIVEEALEGEAGDALGREYYDTKDRKYIARRGRPRIDADDVDDRPRERLYGGQKQKMWG
jgi:hypothetical protein